MPKPTIDVIIPAYNAQDFIVQAIDSVRWQTYPASVIVVDDGSTDLTAERVKNAFGTDGSVRYVNKQNGGLSSARNRGIAESTAEFIAFLDADDVWLPHKLSEQMEIFQKSKDPKLGVVYCGYETIDQLGHIVSNHSRFSMKPSLRGDVSDQLLCGNYIAGSGSAVLARRECFETAGGFDEVLPSCEDWDMWLRLSRSYHFDFVEKPLVQIRRHALNMNRDRYRMSAGTILFCNKWATEASKRPGALEVWSREHAVAIVGAVIRDFPRTGLYRSITSSMSPQLKRLALRQSPQITFGLLAALVQKMLRR